MCLLPLLLLSGCGFLFGDDGVFRDRGDDYLKAKVMPPIDVPESLDSTTIDEQYVIPAPELAVSSAGSFDVPKPALLSAADLEESVRIQKLSDQQWILVNVPPAQLWPQLRHFLFANKLFIARDQGNQGIMETAWIEPAVGVGNELQKEKYRFIVGQGVQRNTTEIHILEIDDSLKAVQHDKHNWPSRSVNLQRETWMVNKLANYLATSVGAASVSLLAQGISTASKMTVVKDELGMPYLVLKLSHERAWASVAKALEKAEFRIDEQDRQAERYMVSYWPSPRDEDMPGFWGRLFGFDAPEYAELEYAGEQYRIRVNQKSDKVELHIDQLEGEGEGDTFEFTPQEAERIMNLIKGYLT